MFVTPSVCFMTHFACDNNHLRSSTLFVTLFKYFFTIFGNIVCNYMLQFIVLVNHTTAMTKCCELGELDNAVAFD